MQEVDQIRQKNIAENRSIIEQRAESIKRAFLLGADLEFGAQVEKDPEQFKRDLDKYCKEWLKTYTPKC